MNKPILLIDLDECIFPYTINYIPWLKEYQGITKAFPDPNGEHDHFDSEPWHAELDTTFINHPIIQLIEPRPDALEAVQALSKKYTLLICTARVKDTHGEATFTWMQNHLPYFDEIIFTSLGFAKPGVSKGEVAKERGAVGLIDDRSLHLDSLLPDYPGYLVNRESPIPSDKGAKSWLEITQSLLEKELLAS